MALFDLFRKKKVEAPARDLIAQAAEDLAGMEDMHAANRYLDELAEKNEGLVKIAHNIYRYGDVMINVGKKFAMQAHAQGLEAVKDWELKSAPKLIAFSVLKNGSDCVLITQIDGISKTMPVPCQGLAWRAVSAQGKSLLIEDVQKLCARGVMNGALLNTREWHVIEATGCIVVSNWSALRRLASESEGHGVLSSVTEEFSDRGI